MNKINKIFWGIIAIIIILGIAFVSNKSGVSREEVVKIGWMGPLTGDVAIVGIENLNGVKLAVDKINDNGGIDGKTIDLIVKDDQYKESESLTQYKQLVNVEGVKYILSDNYGSFFVLSEQAEQDGVILIDSIDTSEEFTNLSKNAFAVGIYDESIGYAIADYLNDNNIDSIGMVYNLEDPFTTLIKDALVERYKGVIDEEESYSSAEKDFRAIVTKMSNQENIVLLGWEETGLIVKRIKELGIEAKIFGIDVFASEDFRNNTRDNYEGLFFSFWQGSEDNEEFNSMVASYKSKFNKNPDNILFVGVGYDAMLVLGETMKGCDDNVECTIENLSNIKDFQGATGLITMDEDNITRSIVEEMFYYKDGMIKKVD